MFHQRRQDTICFAKTYERSKKSCRVFLLLRQVQSYWRNGEKLRPAKRRSKSIETFTKKRNNDMKRHCRDIKKIIWMKWRLLTSTKGATRRSWRYHSLKKHQIQAMKKRLLQSPHSLKKHQVQTMKKNLLHRPYTLKKRQSHLNFLTRGRKMKKKKDCLYCGWKKKSKVFLIFGRIVKIWQSKKRWKR